MFRHYEKLTRLGYSEYVSINRLDIRHANDSVFDLADRSRYADQALASPGTLVVPTSTSVVRVKGQIIKVSEGFATLRVAPANGEAVRTAASATKYNKGILIFDQVGVERAVEVVEALQTSPKGRTDVLLSFRSLLETELVMPTALVEVGPSLLRIDLGPEPSLFRVVQTTHTVFDLLESVRSFTELSLQSADRVQAPLPTTRIRRLEVSNPFEMFLIGAIASVPILLTVLSQVMKLVKDTSDAAGSVVTTKNAIEAGDQAKRAATERAQRHEVEMETLQLDRLAKQIEVAALVRHLNAVGKDGDPSDLQLDAHTLAKLELLKDQAVHAAGELVLGSGGVDYTIESDTQDAVADDGDSIDP
jgi:hypothetical protein